MSYCETFVASKVPSICKKCLTGKVNHVQTLASECKILLEENTRLRDEYYRLTRLQSGPDTVLGYVQTELLQLQELNRQWRLTLSSMGGELEQPSLARAKTTEAEALIRHMNERKEKRKQKFGCVARLELLYQVLLDVMPDVAVDLIRIVTQYANLGADLFAEVGPRTWFILDLVERRWTPLTADQRVLPRIDHDRFTAISDSNNFSTVGEYLYRVDDSSLVRYNKNKNPANGYRIPRFMTSSYTQRQQSRNWILLNDLFVKEGHQGLADLTLFDSETNSWSQFPRPPSQEEYHLFAGFQDCDGRCVVMIPPTKPCGEEKKD
jgi:hypothetical protein